MISIKVVILLISAIIGQIHSFELQVNESHAIIIVCNNGIEINEAIWKCETSIIDIMSTPNEIIIGSSRAPYLGMGSFDVKNVVAEACAKGNECYYSPTKAKLGDCGYRMFLDLKVECVDNSVELEENSPSGRRNKRQPQPQPSTSQYATPCGSVLAAANSLENRRGFRTTRSPANMGAITSITVLDWLRGTGKFVELVYVMRARLSRNTLQRRETYPVGTDERMEDLDARYTTREQHGDDKGHLLASTLGGPRHILNIVPQDAHLNRVVDRGVGSQWLLIESFLREQIRDHPGLQIDWTMVVHYDWLEQDHTRPTGFGLYYQLIHANGTSEPGVEAYYTNDGRTACVFA